MQGLKELSAQAITALAIIDDARAEKLEEDLRNVSSK